METIILIQFIPRPQRENEENGNDKDKEINILRNEDEDETHKVRRIIHKGKRKKDYKYSMK